MTRAATIEKAARSVIKKINRNHDKLHAPLRWICPWGELVKLIEALEMPEVTAP